ncbi:hypothetical protein [Pseudoduganella violaceinigra]|uniref:hypothetical protein n=1 Tax=Pseudoduganella violaceinigra TaxID=246602 RepID=UPI0004100D51|nr:hypothetical protein [Pseudoduganella violaceinigra]
MKKQTEKKLFAFKVADKKAEADKKPAAKWQAREGVASAGCSFPSERYYRSFGDNGVYC